MTVLTAMDRAYSEDKPLAEILEKCAEDAQRPA